MNKEEEILESIDPDDLEEGKNEVNGLAFWVEANGFDDMWSTDLELIVTFEDTKNVYKNNGTKVIEYERWTDTWWGGWI